MKPSPATLGINDLAKRLREACDGHPHAKIPWPHRLLHEAASAIEGAEKPSVRWWNAAMTRAAEMCEAQAKNGYDGHGRYYEIGANDCAKMLKAQMLPLPAPQPSMEFPARNETTLSETGELDLSEKARLADALDDVKRLHEEKMKFFERTIELERELATAKRQACTSENRTTCSFAPSAIGTRDAALEEAAAICDQQAEAWQQAHNEGSEILAYEDQALHGVANLIRTLKGKS